MQRDCDSVCQVEIRPLLVWLLSTETCEERLEVSTGSYCKETRSIKPVYKSAYLYFCG